MLCIIIIIIIIIVVVTTTIISFMQDIYTYIPETNYVPREYSVAAIIIIISSTITTTTTTTSVSVSLPRACELHHQKHQFQGICLVRASTLQTWCPSLPTIAALPLLIPLD